MNRRWTVRVLGLDVRDMAIAPNADGITIRWERKLLAK